MQTKIEQIQSEATAFARAHRRAPANNLYVPGSRMGTTPEQAFASALEANPEAYSEFRGRHNAGVLIQQLRAAGITFHNSK